MKATLFFGMWLFVCCADKPRVTSIQVYSVLHTISTPRSMHAQDVIGWREKEFWKSRTIILADSISYVLQLIENLERDSSCFDIDARCVMLLQQPMDTDTLYGNYACLFYQGKTFKSSDEINKIFWGTSFDTPR
jgi:hypothetical protein